MASLFQIRRGSGSVDLNAGELYTNQTSRSLQIGIVDSGSITLAKLNETNSGSFDISGDLFVSGNARIVGNLTFGDSDAIDTVTIVASFSSSLIPQSTNNFDLGDSTTYWKTGYITSVTGSLSGSVDNINVTQFSASVSQSIGTLNNTAAVYDSRLDNLEQHSGSVNAFTASITASYNATSESLNVVSQSLVDVSSSYIATSQSFDIVSSSLLLFSASQYNADSTSFDNRLDLVETTASILTDFSASISTSVGLLQEFSSSEYKTDSASFDQRLDAVQSYTASLKAAIQVSGSGVASLTTIYGDLRVEGTQSIINSENLAVKDNLIYLNDSSSITNPDLGIVGNYNDGTYAHTGIYRESSTGKWRVFTGLTDEPSGSINDGHPSFQLADFEANEISASINGIGRVGAYSTSVDSRLVSLEATGSNVVSRVGSIETYTASVSTSVGLLQHFSSSEYIADSSSFNDRTTLLEATASYLHTTFSTSVDLRLDEVEATASYLYTTFSTSVDSRTTLLEATASYLYTTFSTSVDSRVDSLENFSASQYINDSSSFTTRISASTLTFNDTTGQTGIDFTQVGTQLSAIASGLSTTSSVHFNNITASNSISASGTVYCDTLVATTLVGATLPVLEYETNGTLGNILIKGATAKSIQVVDTITFQGLTQNGADQYSAGALYMTGSITASEGFSGSVNGIGNVTLYSQSVDSRLQIVSASAWGAFQSASAYSASAAAIYAITGSNTFSGSQNIVGDITASGNLFVSGTIYAYELHTVIESSSVFYSSGSNQIGDNQNDVLTITGSLYQTGSTSFSELTGSLFDFSSSVNSRISSSNVSVTALSQSVYDTLFWPTTGLSASFASSSLYNTTVLSASVYDAIFAPTSTALSYSFASQSLFNSSSVSSSISELSSSVSQSIYNLIYFPATGLSASIDSRLDTLELGGGFGVSDTTGQTGIDFTKSGTSISAVASGLTTTSDVTFNNITASANIRATGDIIAYYSSDERLKDNIQLISNPIQKVNELRGVEFDWKDGIPKAGQHDYGVIAQDVLKVMPELVNQRPNGYYAVDYDKIVGLLIEVVKEQEKRIKDLENKIGS